MRLKKGIILMATILSMGVGSVSMAATYTSSGFIAKSFKIDSKATGLITTVTGSVLYQKGTLKDTCVFEGITTQHLTAEFIGYMGNSSTENKVHNITLPLYSGTYKYRYEHKGSTSYTYAKLKIYSSNGTNYLVATQN